MPTLRSRIGVLTPSSNTVLEPVTSAILAGLDGITAHFSRFPVTKIALSGDALAQFDPVPMLAAARLLADARVGVIAWSGTSASWLGFERDDALCAAITAETGIPACTAVQALKTLIDRHPKRRIGLVTPYTEDVQAQIKTNYHRAGYRIVADAYFDISDNFAFAQISRETIADVCTELVAARPDCLVILCTNMSGAAIVPELEARLGLPVYDSAAAVVWHALHMVGTPPHHVTGWGSLFRH